MVSYLCVDADIGSVVSYLSIDADIGSVPNSKSRTEYSRGRHC